jgi:hypothetical protein
MITQLLSRRAAAEVFSRFSSGLQKKRLRGSQDQLLVGGFINL